LGDDDSMDFGDHILLSYTYVDGSPQADFPMRVIEDEPDRLSMGFGLGIPEPPEYPGRVIEA
jgi:hypothetical protein